MQGVGFRPFVYRLAKKYNLNGNVANRTDGVVVNLYGDDKLIKSFEDDIIKLAPPVAVIKNIFLTDASNEFHDFEILPSENNEQVTEISPDIAICNDCLEDLKSQKHRINYPFINCTNCGPRFSIVKKIPYDRPNTSMNEFKMCSTCNQEYNNVLDRRFHAQPVACNYCGPTYLLNQESDFNKIMDQVVLRINNGEIAVVKGLGGYNIMCDAKNNNAIRRIREIKGRDGKPFALLFKNVESIKKYCVVNNKEQEVLESWQKPVVILEEKLPIANYINNGINSVGAMLPYLPFHHLLFDKIKTDILVYTSANISGSPIISDDIFAKYVLKGKVDSLVTHNRKIENPLDDSVVKVVADNLQIVRRARGYVPKPIYLNKCIDGVFAVGAELKNAFGLGKNNSAIISQYIGDIKNLETYSFYENTIEKYFELFRFKPKVIACDMHPEYLSSQLAEKINSSNLNGNKIPIVRVQHHHAHIASCLAENQINDKVIGICFDGTGYGTDENIWGGEFLISDSRSFERYAHFEYMRMPGGDMAVQEPWRMLFAYLSNISYKNIKGLSCYNEIQDVELEWVSNMLLKNINSPLTSSSGRLFDSVSCLLNLCTKQTFDAEAPMRLESIIDKYETGYYSYTYYNRIIKFGETISSILNDLERIEIGKISAKFHNTIVQVILDVSDRIRKETGISNVVLSGGTFQNKYLLEKTIHILNHNKFEVYTNRLVPPNDGGIALGQLIVASNFI